MCLSLIDLWSPTVPIIVGAACVLSRKISTWPPNKRPARQVEVLQSNQILLKREKRYDDILISYYLEYVLT